MGSGSVRTVATETLAGAGGLRAAGGARRAAGGTGRAASRRWDDRRGGGEGLRDSAAGQIARLQRARALRSFCELSLNAGGSAARALRTPYLTTYHLPEICLQLHELHKRQGGGFL